MSEQTINIADNAPPTLNHVVASGENRKVQESIRIAVEASFNSARPMPHVLLCGGAGTGKSMYSALICKELGVEPVTVLGQTLRNLRSVVSVVTVSASPTDSVAHQSRFPRRVAIQTMTHIGCNDPEKGDSLAMCVSCASFVMPRK